MNFDSPSNISLSISVVLHIGLIALLGFGHLNSPEPSKMPMLLEVTLAGENAPYSLQKGDVADGTTVIAPVKTEAEQPEEKSRAEDVAAWREIKRQKIIRELARDQRGKNIGMTPKIIRQSHDGLASGRGAGEWGQPGSPKGALSFTGEIATRGYHEPDFSLLKGMIIEETQLRLTILVLPEGEVKKAILLETSGYPFVDQKAIELSNKILFDPLPADWKQVEQQGILTIKLKLQ